MVWAQLAGGGNCRCMHLHCCSSYLGKDRASNISLHMHARTCCKFKYYSRTHAQLHTQDHSVPNPNTITCMHARRWGVQNLYANDNQSIALNRGKMYLRLSFLFFGLCIISLSLLFPSTNKHRDINISLTFNFDRVTGGPGAAQSSFVENSCRPTMDGEVQQRPRSSSPSHASIHGADAICASAHPLMQVTPTDDPYSYSYIY